MCKQTLLHNFKFDMLGLLWKFAWLFRTGIYKEYFWRICEKILVKYFIKGFNTESMQGNFMSSADLAIYMKTNPKRSKISLVVSASASGESRDARKHRGRERRKENGGKTSFVALWAHSHFSNSSNSFEIEKKLVGDVSTFTAACVVVDVVMV